MNYFSDKKDFIQEQVGHDGNWSEILTLSKTKRKQVMQRMINTHKPVVAVSPEKQLLDNFDTQLADLERSRLKMETQLKDTKNKLRDLMRKRVKLVKVLGLDEKTV